MTLEFRMILQAARLATMSDFLPVSTTITKSSESVRHSRAVISPNVLQTNTWPNFDWGMTPNTTCQKKNQRTNMEWENTG